MGQEASSTSPFPSAIYSELDKLPFCLFFFCLYHITCELLVPQPGIKPVLPVVEAWSSNQGIPNAIVSF